MKKRNLLIGLIVFVALMISVSISFASSDKEACDSRVSSVCVSSAEDCCYFFLAAGRGARASDRCWYDDHRFKDGI